MRSVLLFFALAAVLYVSIRVGEELLFAPDNTSISTDSVATTRPSRETSPSPNRGSIRANVTIIGDQPAPADAVKVTSPSKASEATDAGEASEASKASEADDRPHTLIIIKRPDTPLKTRPTTSNLTTHDQSGSVLSILETQAPVIHISNGSAELILPHPSPEKPPIDSIVIIDVDEDSLPDPSLTDQARSGLSSSQPATALDISDGSVPPPPSTRPQQVPPPPTHKPRRFTTPPEVPLYYLQLASFADEDKAYRTAKSWQEQHKSRLGHVRLGIMPVTINDQVWWRVVTEDMTRQEAIALRNKLESSGQDWVLRNAEGDQLEESR